MKVALRRRILIAAVAAFVVLAVVWGFMPRAVSVEAVKAVRGPLRSVVEEEGKTRVTDRFVVSAPVAGYVRRIGLEVGDKVSKGQMIAELEPQRSRSLDPRSMAEARAKAAAASASLREAAERAKAAQADYRYASAEFDRIKGLYQGGYAAKDAFDRAESSFDRAKAAQRSSEFAVEVARFELDAASTALKQYTGGSRTRIPVNSPVSGRVLKVIHKSEGAVNEGEPLIEVGDPRSLEVTTELLSQDAVKVSTGTIVEFDRWGGEGTLTGRVRVVEPAGFTKVSALGVEEQRVVVITDFTSPQDKWERLGDGYRVEASFIVWKGEKILKIPSSALFRHKGGWAVFAVENRTALRRAVRIGRQGGLETEVLEGVKEGESVITHPSDSIEDGTKVRLR